jgi:hypothetical protein
MPIKFKPTIRSYNRTTGKTTVIHTYMKNQSNKTLWESVASNNTIPKLRAKVMNELVRRGVTAP